MIIARIVYIPPKIIIPITQVASIQERVVLIQWAVRWLGEPKKRDRGHRLSLGGPIKGGLWREGDPKGWDSRRGLSVKTLSEFGKAFQQQLMDD
jgi:hypothetical protein